MSQPLKSLAPAFVRSIELDYFPALVSPLSVNAGIDQSIINVLTATLSGSATAASGSTPTLAWTLVSGPGTATIDDPDQASSNITVSAYGDYVFRLTATLGTWSDYDDVTISFQNVPVVPDRVLVVAGGGGGGRYYGGGGGGGAVKELSIILLPQVYAVTVGLGGPASVGFGIGTNGGNSSFGADSCDGGGYGGGGNTGPVNGGNGGNGGGMGGTQPATGGIATMGFNGGDGNGNGPGGGGGASEKGATGGAPHPGRGGEGFTSDISGVNEVYGSGGGGASSNEQGPGGTNAGTGGDDSHDATAAVPNFGGGGGGGSSLHTASAGASGVVIVRYVGAVKYSGGTITTVGTDTVHKFTSSGSLIPL